MTSPGRLLGGLCAMVILITVLGITSVRAGGTAGSDSEPFDCGTLALYVLLRLEGRPVELTDLVSKLPPPSMPGYSMSELRETSRRCGLTLAGVRVPRSKRQPDRPILAILKRGPHGHYVVVRPVGHTGKLVQVLDYDREPEVCDAAKLYASREWTGLALLPVHPNWPARAAWAVLLAGIGLVLVHPLRRRLSLTSRVKNLAHAIASRKPNGFFLETRNGAG